MWCVVFMGCDPQYQCSTRTGNPNGNEPSLTVARTDILLGVVSKGEGEGSSTLSI